MAPSDPSPNTWTIRFKNHKHTTLLHIEPLQPFDSIIEELLRALSQTRPDGHLPNGVRIPDSADDVLLAKPVDINDYTAGWTRIRLSEDDVSDNDELDISMKESEDKRRSNGARSKRVSTSSAATAAKKRADADDKIAYNPKTVGLKDGAVIAYKFKSLEQDDWDVVIASYEDSAGVINEGDVGGLKMTV